MSYDELVDETRKEPLAESLPERLMPLSVKHTAIDPTKSIALGTSNITQAEVNVALREIKSQKKRQATRAKNRAKRK